jgi:hypothetical protein
MLVTATECVELVIRRDGPGVRGESACAVQANGRVDATARHAAWRHRRWPGRAAARLPRPRPRPRPRPEPLPPESGARQKRSNARTMSASFSPGPIVRGFVMQLARGIGGGAKRDVIVARPTVIASCGQAG